MTTLQASPVTVRPVTSNDVTAAAQTISEVVATATPGVYHVTIIETIGGEVVRQAAHRVTARDARTALVFSHWLLRANKMPCNALFGWR